MQSPTPDLGAALVPAVLFGLGHSGRAMVTACLSTGLALLLLSTSVALPAEQAAPIESANGLSVAAVNLLYRNERVDDVAVTLGRIAPDLIVFSEYTVDHQSILQSSGLAADYPHHIDRSAPGGGTALWSRYLVAVRAPPDMNNYPIDLSVAGPDGSIRLLALRVPAPTSILEGWKHGLDAAALFARAADGAAIVIGDLNATYWHPPFRDLLGAGLTDAHTALRRGFSASWPTDRLVPPFVRLDHALVTDELVAIDFLDFDTPGSDHRGFVLTVAPAR